MLHTDVKCNDNFIANALSRVGWYCDELKYISKYNAIYSSYCINPKS
jgi:hypothetical protein